MARSITGATLTALTAVPAEPIMLWEGLFDSGALRVWSGIGNLSWDSKTWIGAGEWMGVDPAAEVTRVIASSATFRLNGADPALIALALGENYQGRLCGWWLGALSAGAVVADPYKVFAGRMDQMEIVDHGDSVDLSLTAESHIAALETAPNMHYTDADQKSDYPTDEGLSLVVPIQDREVIWK